MHVRCLESLMELTQMLALSLDLYCSCMNSHFIINFPLNLNSFSSILG